MKYFVHQSKLYLNNLSLSTKKTSSIETPEEKSNRTKLINFEIPNNPPPRRLNINNLDSYIGYNPEQCPTKVWICGYDELALEWRCNEFELIENGDFDPDTMYLTREECLENCGIPESACPIIIMGRNTSDNGAFEGEEWSSDNFGNVAWSKTEGNLYTSIDVSIPFVSDEQWISSATIRQSNTDPEEEGYTEYSFTIIWNSENGQLTGGIQAINDFIIEEDPVFGGVANTSPLAIPIVPETITSGIITLDCNNNSTPTTPTPTPVPCTECLKDCTATNNGLEATYVCSLTPLYGEWEWIDGTTTYRIFLAPYRTEGYSEINCGGTQLYSSVTDAEGNQRTFSWGHTLIYDENGCLASIQIDDSGTQESAEFCSGTSEACFGSNCGDLIPPVPNIAYTCVDISIPTPTP